MNSKDCFVTAIVFAFGSGIKHRSSPRKCHEKAALVLLAAGFAWTGAASAQEHAIDTAKSVMTVRVYKAGVFSAFGHNHEIAAPIGKGTVNTAAHQVELHIDASSLRVRDPEESQTDREEIQRTMQGPEVLDIEHYSKILFGSTGAEPTGADSWRARGNLTLHGQTRPVIVDVKQRGGHYVGASRFKQTDFGITPIKFAGGTVRVKDEIQIEFDIQLER